MHTATFPYLDYSIARALRDSSVVREIRSPTGGIRYSSPSPFEYPEEVTFSVSPGNGLRVALKYGHEEKGESQHRMAKGIDRFDLLLSSDTGKILELRFGFPLPPFLESAAFMRLTGAEPELSGHLTDTMRKTFASNLAVVQAILRSLPPEMEAAIRDAASKPA